VRPHERDVRDTQHRTCIDRTVNARQSADRRQMGYRQVTFCGNMFHVVHNYWHVLYGSVSHVCAPRAFALRPIRFGPSIISLIYVTDSYACYPLQMCYALARVQHIGRIIGTRGMNRLQHETKLMTKALTFTRAQNTLSG
jgi:hypothetical protein